MIELIQAMLAPAIMISATGLLLLGMNNKYSLVISRIRTLNVEFRSLEEGNVNRRNCILKQLPHLRNRMRLIKNTVWLYTISIGFFIFTMLGIGLSNYFHSDFMQDISVILFTTGMLSLLSGVFYAAHEVRLGYKILNIELAGSIGEEMD